MNIIFGVYNGYNALKAGTAGIYYFLKSLRKYSDCKVVIICEEDKIFEDLILFSHEMNFEIYSNFKLQYNMMFYRFIIYKKYLSEQNLTFDKVLLSDISDVIFQENPFSINCSEDLYCGLEQNILSDLKNTSSIVNMHWIKECNHISNTNNNYENKYVICAGTILGSYKGIIDYLNYYEQHQNKPSIINDQGLLNYYIYNVSCSSTCLNYKESKILTLDGIKFENLNIVDNKIVNNNGEIYSIIHQINRCNLPFMLSLV